MQRWIERASDLVGRATSVLVVLAAVVMMVSLILQIVFRYLVGQALVWSEELALFLFTWIVLLAASLGVREGFHVRMSLVLDALPAGLRQGAERLIDLLVLGFGVALAYAGGWYVQATLGQTSAAVQYPIEWLHAAAPAGGGLIAFHALCRLLTGGAAPGAKAETLDD